MEGPLESERKVINEIQPRKLLQFHLSVKPFEHGEHVPVKLLLLGPSGTQLYSENIYMNITRGTEEQTSGAKFITNINNSNGIIIGDKNETDQDFQKSSQEQPDKNDH